MTRGSSMLLIDDSEAELELMEQYLAEFRVRIDRATSGADALDFLFARGRYAARPPGPPAIVIIDNKMPLMDGIEAVRQMRMAPSLRFMPIVMWSGSDDASDIRRAYESGVSSYLVKPASATQAREALRATAHYWLALNRLPA